MRGKGVTEKSRNILWAKSAGRCQFEGCNHPLYVDILTKKSYNTAYVAHIVSSSPNGPRGDKIRSPLLCDDIENLMLLCDAHHTLIDSKTGIKEYSEDCLLEMKRQHEDRIRQMTSIDVNKSSNIVLYGANIGKNNSPLSYEVACNAFNGEYYPADNQAIELGIKNTPFNDGDNQYWEMEEANLMLQFNEKIKPKLMNCTTDHYSIFALAPQPLLIKLGTLHNDLYSTRVYQKHREPCSWKWQTDSTPVEYSLHEPHDKSKIPVLIFSLSATIGYDRIEKTIGKNTSIWEITIDTPHNDFLKTEKTLSDFRYHTRFALNKIKAHHGCMDLMIFPAMPASAAIELGRLWMPKADMPLIIFDENRENSGFHKALIIK